MLPVDPDVLVRDWKLKQYTIADEVRSPLVKVTCRPEIFVGVVLIDGQALVLSGKLLVFVDHWLVEEFIEKSEGKVTTILPSVPALAVDGFAQIVPDSEVFACSLSRRNDTCPNFCAANVWVLFAKM